MDTKLQEIFLNYVVERSTQNRRLPVDAEGLAGAISALQVHITIFANSSRKTVRYSELERDITIERLTGDDMVLNRGACGHV